MDNKKKYKENAKINNNRFIHTNMYNWNIYAIFIVGL
jgi:hypothetical protein